jgi:hypothetical protein
MLRFLGEVFHEGRSIFNVNQKDLYGPVPLYYAATNGPIRSDAESVEMCRLTPRILDECSGEPASTLLVAV